MIGKYDIAVAKKLWREKIAEARKVEFEKNDLALRDAMLANDKAKIDAAIARRDQLRAIGDRIDAATSITDLLAIVP